LLGIRSAFAKVSKMSLCRPLAQLRQLQLQK
jgi:hypothetical protein